MMPLWLQMWVDCHNANRLYALDNRLHLYVCEDVWVENPAFAPVPSSFKTVTLDGGAGNWDGDPPSFAELANIWEWDISDLL